MVELKTPAVDDRFSKTEAGRQEIRARAHALPRSARNLLLILDDTRPAAQWLTMVQGAGLADLQVLVQAQLVESVPAVQQQGGVQHADEAARQGTSGAVTREAKAPSSAVTTAPVSFNGLSYAELYTGLNQLVREQLGLIKSYRISLEIERASGLADLEEVALRFVEEVHKAHGEAAARQVRRTLKLP